MLWNELEYSVQQKVIDRIVSLLEDEKDEVMVDGLISAVHELEVWSNSPCQVIGEDMAYEQDPFCEKGWSND